MPWLFAIDATSIEPPRSARNAVAGVRKVNSFEAAAPVSVTAVSRFATAMSACPSTGAIGASIPEGSAASLLASTPSKCTSPPKAKVTGLPLPSGRACSERATCGRNTDWLPGAGSRPSRTAAVTTSAQRRPGNHETQPSHGPEVSDSPGFSSPAAVAAGTWATSEPEAGFAGREACPRALPARHKRRGQVGEPWVPPPV